MFGSHQGCEAASPTPCSIRSLFLARQRIYMDFFFSSLEMGQEVMPVTLCVNR